MSNRKSSPQFTLRVSGVNHRVRIETFLVRQFRNYTLFRMQRIVAGGGIKIRNRPASVGERIFTGDEVVVRLIEPPDKLYEPENLALEILYEDPWLVVLDKPVDMVCHPVSHRQTGTVCNALQAHFDRQTEYPGLLRPGIVHRLDRQTSGLLVVSKLHDAHYRLVQQFENSEVHKEYLAVVEGVIERDRGEIVRPIGISSRNRMFASVESSARKKKPARTGFFVEERYPDRTLVRVIPRTGRLHQVRVHFASIGNPIVGDVFYEDVDTKNCGLSNSPTWSVEEGNNSERRHLLHASSLQFQHPILNRKMAFRSPRPIDMRNCIGTNRRASASVA